MPVSIQKIYLRRKFSDDQNLKREKCEAVHTCNDLLDIIEKDSNFKYVSMFMACLFIVNVLVYCCYNLFNG